MEVIKENFTMPFGKYKGEFLEDIPIQYLDWMLENADLKNNIKNRIRKHLQTRNIVMPFGKYEGEDLSDIPKDYLEYCLNNFNLSNTLKSAIQDEYESRDEYEEATQWD